ncbi:MAG: flavodoxin family protein [Eubacteriaceae bacterium]|jgi:multimeric flavodoxin WrbA
MIAVITGSPRKNGNSSAMADSFIRAAESRGQEVRRFDTAFMDLQGCQACDCCWDADTPCIYNDDFNEAAEAILDADAIVLVTPVYWYTFPAQIKNMIDRWYSLCRGTQDFKGKKCMLMACCEEDTMSTFDGMKFSFEKTIALLHGDITAELLIPDVNKAGDINKTGALERAAALADLL